MSLEPAAHCYPECIAEVSKRYKSTAAERRMWSRQWELHHCSIVYTVGLPYGRNVGRRVVLAIELQSKGSRTAIES